MGESLRQRSKKILSLIEGIDLALTVAVEGRASCPNFPTRTDEQRQEIYRCLQSEHFNCSTCGVKLVFLSKASFEQFSVDRTVFGEDGRSLPYTNSLQVLNRSCYFCNLFFGDSDRSERAQVILTLIQRYNDILADKIIQSVIDESADEEIAALQQHTPDTICHWEKVWDRQSQYYREKFKKCRPPDQRPAKRSKTVPDIRDWTFQAET